MSQTLKFILGHPMNKGRPISTLVRFARWQVQSRLQDEVIFDWINGAKLAVRRGMTGATGNIYCGLHEYVDMRFVLDTLTPGDFFVDIGANVGSYTVLASKVCGVRTIAVEPDPDTAKALRRNIEVNGIEDRVRVVEAALGATAGTVSFTVGRDTVNRVALAGDENVREVPVRTLDGILDGEVPRVIKIDVEGFEAEVFRGASATLADPRLEAVITEALDQDVLDILERAGFKEKYYDPDLKAACGSQRHSSSNSLMVR
ncbi:FkbM family methyltransferase [Aestuariicoccus sp. MJ-SS9]|uniref:FkbM family methyltransferase n=1 Tax=Aestuariicoccus sp. MJ-SS9 TaxID=3079855 RepID=UPI00290DD17F|nr:FkbM family methyltransferase [Aestuariicoccus sp. MJ-SS9]MDU8913525.1 FkbM family methyltransferase [Aestuariicoccus sp. MJ-SS9]